MRHEITINDVEKYEFEHQICGSFGGGENKKLMAIVKGKNVKYEVWNNARCVYKTTDINRAVATYNLYRD